MTLLIEKKSDELELIVFECVRCHAYESEKDGHVCQDLRERMQKKSELFTKLSNGEIVISDALNIISEIDMIEMESHMKDLEELTQKFPEKVYAQVVRKRLLEILSNIEKMRAKIYDRNDEMRAQGKTFAERKEYLSSQKERLKFCDSEIERLGYEVDNFVLIPYYEWLQPGDCDAIRRMGYTKFIRIFGVDCKWCYKVKK